MTSAFFRSACVVALVGCGPALPPGQLAPLNAAFQAAATDVAPIITAETTAQARARRDASVRAGRLHYRLTPGCGTFDIDAALSDLSAGEIRMLVCERQEIAAHAPTDAENAAAVLAQISRNLAEVDALSRATLHADVAASAGRLLREVNTLAAQPGQTAPWLLHHPDTASAVLRFGLERHRARVLRRAVARASAPFDQAVLTVIACLLAEGQRRDPLVQTSERLMDAETAMRAAPGNAASVAAFEAAFTADARARAQSPAIRLVQVQQAHRVLAARLEGPASLDEVSALIQELARLGTLLDAN